MEEKLTPLMQQYFSIRKEHPDTILFFQVGDFYELFFDDAVLVSSYLAITLTKRGKCKGEDIPLCGVPVHAINYYLTKLIKGGFRVAVCDQLTEATPGQVVERGVRQVFTPGTLTDLQMLDEKNSSYLLSFFPLQDRWGVVFGELLTAQLFATTLDAGLYRTLEGELYRFLPDEILVPHDKLGKQFNEHFKKLGYWVSSVGENAQLKQAADEWLTRQFNPNLSEKIGNSPALKETMLQFYQYLYKTQKSSLDQFKNIQFYEPDEFLLLDPATQRNLEIVKNNQDGTRKNSVLEVVDRAKTSMGSRMVKRWLLRPLVNEEAITDRHTSVAEIKESVELLQKLESLLCELPDLERVVGRIAIKRANVVDYIAIKNALNILPRFNLVLSGAYSKLLKIIKSKIPNLSPLSQLLNDSLNDDFESKKIIKDGFSEELDRLRAVLRGSQQEILKLEQQEIERTGINSLKIRYNNFHGYSIEITKVNLGSIPADYIRQQTLSNRERYVTKELMELEKEINRAQGEVGKVEQEIFESVKSALEEHLSLLRTAALALSYLDALFSFAKIAYENNFVQPVFNKDRILKISGGKHLVVEAKIGQSFVVNDTNLDKNKFIWVITGPNMGGKSTYLRQVALISLLAQCGSFVPASSAMLPILDRIFSRVGSADNLAEGKSTFWVEMEETALICNNATDKTLVILDEVGRGTSTFDGVAIAHAVIEHLAKKTKSFSLFATHYLELTRLESELSELANYHMLAQKSNDELIFLHKIEKGVAEGSFGIEVAKLANMPPEVVERAFEILKAYNSA